MTRRGRQLPGPVIHCQPSGAGSCGVWPSSRSADGAWREITVPALDDEESESDISETVRRACLAYGDSCKNKFWTCLTAAVADILVKFTSFFIEKRREKNILK